MSEGVSEGVSEEVSEEVSEGVSEGVNACVQGLLVTGLTEVSGVTKRLLNQWAGGHRLRIAIGCIGTNHSAKVLFLREEAI